MVAPVTVPDCVSAHQDTTVGTAPLIGVMSWFVTMAATARLTEHALVHKVSLELLAKSTIAV